MQKSTQKESVHHDVAGKDILASTDEKFRRYRQLWEENPLKLNYGSFPLHLDLEVTSICNLKCPFCTTTYSSFSNGMMSWDTIKKILDEAGKEGLYACKFNFRGEPLLHKDLGKFIRYAKDAGIIDVYFNTNAALLTEEKARMLIESGLDRLTVSFEGYEKETYEASRVGAKFDEVVANVERLKKMRDEMGSATPKIRVQAVMTPDMKGKLDGYINFWEKKVDQVSYNEMDPTVETALKTIKKFDTDWICPYPYQRMTVMWDGSVTTCQHDYYGKQILGNVQDVSIKECWVEHLNNVRKLHNEGRSHELGACNECPLRMSEHLRREAKEGSESHTQTT